VEIAIIPNFIIRAFFHDDKSQIRANILMTNILIITVLIFFRNHYVHLLSLPHFCVFHKLFNVPCPGCGVAQSILSIVKGDISFAWRSNPAGLFLFFYIVAQIPLSIIALTIRSAKNHISYISRFGSKIVIIVLFLVWILRLI